jgi:hypothetical protein
MKSRVSINFYPNDKKAGKRFKQFNIIFVVLNIVFLFVNLFLFVDIEEENYKNGAIQTSTTKLINQNNMVATFPIKDTFQYVSIDTFEKPFMEEKFENQSIIHIVEKGQTLFSISHRYGVSIDSIKMLNRLIDNTINIGMELKIPIVLNKDKRL